MGYAVHRMARPLTAAERRRITAARRKLDRLQTDLAAATLERDLAILDAYNRRVKVTEIADTAGLSRQTVHAILNRLAERGADQAWHDTA